MSFNITSSYVNIKISIFPKNTDISLLFLFNYLSVREFNLDSQNLRKELDFIQGLFILKCMKYRKKTSIKKLKTN